VVPQPDADSDQPSQATESVGEINWGEVVPRNLYARKPDALRAAPSCSSGPSSASGGPSSPAGSSVTEPTHKRTITEELEWAKICKRRRPSLAKDEHQVKLTIAKLELTEATKAQIEDERRRSEELFAIEKQKKESEAELARL
jgi:hypothetical protein